MIIDFFTLEKKYFTQNSIFLNIKYTFVALLGYEIV